MQLLIKQRVFSWSDTYDIYDEQGNQKYFVKNEFISLGHRLHVYDAAHNEIGFIKQKLFCFLPTFEIEWNGQLMCLEWRQGRCGYENFGKYSVVYIWRHVRRTCMDFCRMHLVYYDCWNSVWTAVFQDGKAFVYAIWHECNWIKGVWKKIGLPVFFYAYHEAAIPLMQIET